MSATDGATELGSTNIFFSIVEFAQSRSRNVDDVLLKSLVRPILNGHESWVKHRLEISQAIEPLSPSEREELSLRASALIHELRHLFDLSMSLYGLFTSHETLKWALRSEGLLTRVKEQNHSPVTIPLTKSVELDSDVLDQVSDLDQFLWGRVVGLDRPDPTLGLSMRDLLEVSAIYTQIESAQWLFGKPAALPLLAHIRQTRGYDRYQEVMAFVEWICKYKRTDFWLAKELVLELVGASLLQPLQIRNPTEEIIQPGECFSTLVQSLVKQDFHAWSLKDIRQFINWRLRTLGRFSVEEQVEILRRNFERERDEIKALFRLETREKIRSFASYVHLERGVIIGTEHAQTLYDSINNSPINILQMITAGAFKSLLLIRNNLDGSRSIFHNEEENHQSANQVRIKLASDLQAIEYLLFYQHGNTPCLDDPSRTIAKSLQKDLRFSIQFPTDDTPAQPQNVAEAVKHENRLQIVLDGASVEAKADRSYNAKNPGTKLTGLRSIRCPSCHWLVTQSPASPLFSEDKHGVNPYSMCPHCFERIKWPKKNWISRFLQKRPRATETREFNIKSRVNSMTLDADRYYQICDVVIGEFLKKLAADQRPYTLAAFLSSPLPGIRQSTREIIAANAMEKVQFVREFDTILRQFPESSWLDGCQGIVWLCQATGGESIPGLPPEMMSMLAPVPAGTLRMLFNLTRSSTAEDAIRAFKLVTQTGAVGISQLGEVVGPGNNGFNVAPRSARVKSLVALNSEIDFHGEAKPGYKERIHELLKEISDFELAQMCVDLMLREMMGNT